jgi:hypothetical protein
MNFIAPTATAANLHKHLARYNRRRMSFDQPADWQAALEEEHDMRLLEGRLIEELRSEITPLLADVPHDPDAFMDWFEALRDHGPGQGDALFPWLAEEATYDEMRWFLSQEVAGEAGFDDLVALTQIRLPAQAKLELARNYWDEMGRGNLKGMHGPMLARVAEAFNIHPIIEDIVWESHALANLMLGLAANRRYAFQSVGALGVIEMTAPARVSHVDAGLRRLGAEPQVRQYFSLHAALDVRHSEAWNSEAIRPLVAENPDLTQPIAEGALMRLTAGKKCFARYKRELDVPSPL